MLIVKFTDQNGTSMLLSSNNSLKKEILNNQLSFEICQSEDRYLYLVPSSFNYLDLADTSPISLEELTHLLQSQSGSFSLKNIHQSIISFMKLNPTAEHRYLIERNLLPSFEIPNDRYALPIDFSDKFKREVPDTLMHCWAWEKAKSIFPKTNRLVSVMLNNTPNAVSIQNGSAISGSQSDGGLEGLSGLLTCGEIDPDFIIQLAQKGYRPSDIENIFNNNSGWSSLDSKVQSINDIFYLPESLSSRLFQHQLKKSIGSLISTMKGVDTLVFFNDRPELCVPWLQPIFQSLEFLGFSKSTEYQEIGPAIFMLNSNHSSINALLLPNAPSQAMVELFPSANLLDLT